MNTSTFSLVENPGLANEATVDSGLSYQQALARIRSQYTHAEVADGFVQVMRELPDGSLTTEF